MNLAQKYLKNKELTKEILQKLYRHVASKGFDYEEINSVMSEIKGGLWNEY